MTEIPYQLFATAIAEGLLGRQMIEAMSISAGAKAQHEADVSPQRKEQLMATAREFETVFVGQMLKYSGLTDALSGDSGHGGEAFSGMLTEQYAGELVEKGGFGLAEEIYQQLLQKEKTNATDAAV